MININLKIVLFFVIALMLQILLVPLISFNNIVPDLIIIFLAVYSIQKGPLPGMFVAAIIGFLFDLMTGGVIGSSMFAKVAATFIGGYFYKNITEEEIPIAKYLWVILLVAFINSFLFALLGSNEYTGFFELLIIQGVMSAIFTTLIAIPFSLFKIFELMR